MRTTALVCLLCVAAASVTFTPAVADSEVQEAHATGTCGSLGPGTGLRDGKGWIVSMLPGQHEVRIRGEGAAYLTVARRQKMDFDAGRPYYIVVEGATASSILQWKVPGSRWAAVPKSFLYPP